MLLSFFVSVRVHMDFIVLLSMNFNFTGLAVEIFPIFKSFLVMAFHNFLQFFLPNQILRNFFFRSQNIKGLFHIIPMVLKQFQIFLCDLQSGLYHIRMEILCRVLLKIQHEESFRHLFAVAISNNTVFYPLNLLFRHLKRV